MLILLSVEESYQYFHTNYLWWFLEPWDDATKAHVFETTRVRDYR